MNQKLSSPHESLLLVFLHPCYFSKHDYLV
uniref:Uncharacterized protein n=1 Tax=Rhizophora mucronata TaxID=61149 RepID=A0A2P2QW23_RHIMU